MDKTKKDSKKSKCFMCENYDNKNDFCKEYNYENCSKITFTTCKGYMVKEKLFNFQEKQYE